MNRPAASRTLLIVGTGALGTLFASRLSAAGYSVTLLGTWHAALQALREHGARVQWPHGQIESHAVQTASSPAEAPPAQAAIVLVKSWQTPRAARWLRECLTPDGVALTLQNGLGNDRILAEALGPERVAVGTTTTGAHLIAAGLVRFGGEGVITLARHPRGAALAAALQDAGFQVETVDDVRGVVWGKLAINAAINPLTALLEVPNGALLEDPAARLFMHRAAAEVAAVAAAQGITLPYADPAAAAETVARRTAPNLSSMLQDLRRGAPTEIEAICGAVAHIGARLGTPAPLNQALTEMVKAKVAQMAPHPSP